MPGLVSPLFIVANKPDNKKALFHRNVICSMGELATASLQTL